MDGLIENGSQDMGHGEVTPEDQAIMTAPRAYLLGYENAICSASKSILPQIEDMKTNLLLVAVSSSICAVVSLALFIIFVTRIVIVP